MPKSPEWQLIHERLEKWNADNNRVPMRLHRLRLVGPVPSKKNAWGIRAGGRIGITDRSVQASIDALILQARIQWGPRNPLEHPTLDFCFHVTSGSQDRDNQMTTLMDVLTKAGVLMDDNTARCNSRIVLHPSRLAIGDPFTEIGLGEIV